MSSTGIVNTQGFQSFTVALGSGSTSTAKTLPVAEPDTSYVGVCNINTNGVGVEAVQVINTSATVMTLNYGNVGITGGQASCIVTHQ